MAKIQKVAGTTSLSAQILIQDSSSTTGAGLTGLTSASTGLTAYYYRPGDSATTAITLTALSTPAIDDDYLSGGFIEIDSTNLPGLYRLDIPDAALASGVENVIVYLQGATNMAPCVLEIQLTSMDFDDGVRGGMTASLILHNQPQEGFQLRQI